MSKPCFIPQTMGENYHNHARHPTEVIHKNIQQCNTLVDMTKPITLLLLVRYLKGKTTKRDHTSEAKYSF